VIHPKDSKRLLFDLLPTAAEDPLLIMNNVRVPDENEAVLSLAASEKLGVAKGDSLTLRATRSRNGKTEYGQVVVKITGVLPASAGILPRIYTPLQLVLDVERFKEGMAVVSRNWQGKQPVPYAALDWIITPGFQL